MIQSYNHFGRISVLTADAIGEPGHRRFRLLAEAPEGRSAVLWLEKEQLWTLGLSIKGLLARSEEGNRRTGEPSPEVEQVVEPSVAFGHQVDLQVGRLGVGYDGRQELYIVTAFSVESVESDQKMPDVSLMASHSEMDALAEEAFRVCAAGRPLCPLCAAPMDPEGHVCPRHNGHARLED